MRAPLLAVAAATAAFATFSASAVSLPPANPGVLPPVADLPMAGLNVDVWHVDGAGRPHVLSIWGYGASPGQALTWDADNKTNIFNTDPAPGDIAIAGKITATPTADRCDNDIEISLSKASTSGVGIKDVPVPFTWRSPEPVRGGTLIRLSIHDGKPVVEVGDDRIPLPEKDVIFAGMTIGAFSRGCTALPPPKG